MKIALIILINVFLIISGPFQITGQEGNLPEVITAIAEQLAEDENEALLSEIFADMLSDLADDPVEINNADENELSRLFFLSGFQVRALSDYISVSGPVLSAPEIAHIPGFDHATASMVIPFISFEQGKIRGSGGKGLKQTLLASFSTGFQPQDEESPPGKWSRSLLRYRVETGSFSGGITAEKDPGERFFSGNPPLPDFFSGYLSRDGKGLIKRIILGDYHLRTGLGVCMNTAMMSGFSLTSPGNLSVRNDLRPYTSSDENSFNRGASLHLRLKMIDLISYYSCKRLDATNYGYDDEHGLYIRSLNNTGYHNTKSSIAGKDILGEQTAGISLWITGKMFRAGLSYLGSGFSAPFLPDSSEPRHYFNFRGSRFHMGSAFYDLRIRRFLLSGELASGYERKKALVQTVTVRPADRLSIYAILKYYDPGFAAFHGLAPGLVFSSGYGTEIYAGFTLEAARNLFLGAGADRYSYKWLRYRNASPGIETRSEIRARYLPSDNISFELAWTWKHAMSDRYEPPGIPPSGRLNSGWIRFRVSLTLTEMVKLTSRIDYKKISGTGSRGFLALQDISFSLKKTPLSVWLRYCIFNTDDFYSGICTWENDLLFGYSAPVLYGSGSRAYLMVRYRPAGFAEARLKIGYTDFTKAGAEKVFRKELKLQVRLIF